jgi:hypothetical protein
MQVTTWFIAKEDEAEAIESIVTTEEHAPEDWMYLELPLIETWWSPSSRHSPG